MHVIVLGLRRSGTTIFWSTLKEDPRFGAAFNEPFNPLIHNVGDSPWYRRTRRYYEAYHTLIKRDGLAFWEAFAPIHPQEELQVGLSDHQQAYLRYLLEQGESCLVEATRCHYKVADLRRVTGPDAVLVHLYRRPESFVTSHLVPSGGVIKVVDMPPLRRRYLLLRSRLKKAYLRRTFWRGGAGFDGWDMLTVAGGENRDSIFAHRCREEGLDPGAVYDMPAPGRLLALWKVCHDRLQRDGAEQFGGRFVSVSLEAFASSPGPTLERVYSAMGQPMPALDLGGLRRPTPPFDEGNPQWGEYMRAVGISA